uniref:Polycystin cation channel PKD1/PKD2 domain-containing protein n=1 Tax=Chromera velia CCMP2878 TaxID=1169474 RepID=A0A0G4I6Z6_9ALVE|eukprot:Cvel_11525.t1-p1 / transcript=Cvel_11525.t1 / gene=Cvel_11525 / organism=Chromera_velia_CCMP2878 / gene_product=hypothetical protein / transcript_product=hypothetical protein / location=Cvel_scaffold727:1349-21561(-) / protein_length=1962 / sequence_SO=supercontig / SO=protein_coding / is_pseudo=false
MIVVDAFLYLVFTALFAVFSYLVLERPQVADIYKACTGLFLSAGDCADPFTLTQVESITGSSDPLSWRDVLVGGESIIYYGDQQVRKLAFQAFNMSFPSKCPKYFREVHAVNDVPTWIDKVLIPGIFNSLPQQTEFDAVCNSEFPCDVGEGDCDLHSDCRGDLLCGTDVAPHPWTSDSAAAAGNTLSCELLPGFSGFRLPMSNRTTGDGMQALDYSTYNDPNNTESEWLYYELVDGDIPSDASTFLDVFDYILNDSISNNSFTRYGLTTTNAQNIWIWTRQYIRDRYGAPEDICGSDNSINSSAAVFQASSTLTSEISKIPEFFCLGSDTGSSSQLGLVSGNVLRWRKCSVNLCMVPHGKTYAQAVGDLGQYRRRFVTLNDYNRVLKMRLTLKRRKFSSNPVSRFKNFFHAVVSRASLDPQAHTPEEDQAPILRPQWEPSTRPLESGETAPWWYTTGPGKYTKEPGGELYREYVPRGDYRAYFGSGGYVEFFEPMPLVSAYGPPEINQQWREQLRQLEREGWFDNRFGTLTADFFIFNGNVQRFLQVAFEFRNSFAGEITPLIQSRGFSLAYFENPTIVASLLLVVALLLYFSIQEVKKLTENPNLDTAEGVISVTDYAALDSVAAYSSTVLSVIAIAICVLCMRSVIYFVEISGPIRIVFLALGRAATYLVMVILILAHALIGFALAAWLIFGPYQTTMKTFIDGLGTSFMVIFALPGESLTPFEGDDSDDGARQMAVVFLLLLKLVIGLVFLSLFSVIIIKAYRWESEAAQNFSSVTGTGAEVSEISGPFQRIQQFLYRRFEFYRVYAVMAKHAVGGRQQGPAVSDQRLRKSVAALRRRTHFVSPQCLLAYVLACVGALVCLFSVQPLVRLRAFHVFSDAVKGYTWTGSLKNSWVQRVVNFDGCTTTTDIASFSENVVQKGIYCGVLNSDLTLTNQSSSRNSLQYRTDMEGRPFTIAPIGGGLDVSQFFTFNENTYVRLTMQNGCYQRASSDTYKYGVFMIRTTPADCVFNSCVKFNAPTCLNFEGKEVDRYNLQGDFVAASDARDKYVFSPGPDTFWDTGGFPVSYGITPADAYISHKWIRKDAMFSSNIVSYVFDLTAYNGNDQTQGYSYAAFNLAPTGGVQLAFSSVSFPTNYDPNIMRKEATTHKRSWGFAHTMALVGLEVALFVVLCVFVWETVILAGHRMVIEKFNGRTRNFFWMALFGHPHLWTTADTLAILLVVGVFIVWHLCTTNPFLMQYSIPGNIAALREYLWTRVVDSGCDPLTWFETKCYEQKTSFTTAFPYDFNSTNRKSLFTPLPLLRAPGDLWTVYTYVTAFTVFVLVVRCIRPGLMNLFFFAALVFFGFALMFNVAFGVLFDDFSSLPVTSLTLFAMIFGDVDVETYKNAGYLQDVIGYYIPFIFVMRLVYLNFSLAIIWLTYSKLTYSKKHRTSSNQKRLEKHELKALQMELEEQIRLKQEGKGGRQNSDELNDDEKRLSVRERHRRKRQKNWQTADGAQGGEGGPEGAGKETAVESPAAAAQAPAGSGRRPSEVKRDFIRDLIATPRGQEEEEPVEGEGGSQAGGGEETYRQSVTNTEQHAIMERAATSELDPLTPRSPRSHQPPSPFPGDTSGISPFPSGAAGSAERRQGPPVPRLSLEAIKEARQDVSAYTHAQDRLRRAASDGDKTKRAAMKTTKRVDEEEEDEQRCAGHEPALAAWLLCIRRLGPPGKPEDMEPFQPPPMPRPRDLSESILQRLHKVMELRFEGESKTTQEQIREIVQEFHSQALSSQTQAPSFEDLLEKTEESDNSKGSWFSGVVESVKAVLTGTNKQRSTPLRASSVGRSKKKGNKGFSQQLYTQKSSLVGGRRESINSASLDSEDLERGEGDDDDRPDIDSADVVPKLLRLLAYSVAVAHLRLLLEQRENEGKHIARQNELLLHYVVQLEERKKMLDKEVKKMKAQKRRLQDRVQKCLQGPDAL